MSETIQVQKVKSKKVEYRCPECSFQTFNKMVFRNHEHRKNPDVSDLKIKKLPNGLVEVSSSENLNGIDQNFNDQYSKISSLLFGHEYCSKTTVQKALISGGDKIEVK